jgi:ADP-ribosylglycohydrolase
MLETAVRNGEDTVTIAAISGALAGAAYGVEGVPDEWRDALHGLPGIRAADLEKLVDEALEPSVARMSGSVQA